MLHVKLQYATRRKNGRLHDTPPCARSGGASFGLLRDFWSTNERESRRTGLHDEKGRSELIQLYDTPREGCRWLEGHREAAAPAA